ncbi:hypothetical protein V1264_000198 [Littorina saxatilis]|uniref:TIR domain-containing protein n=2 Tax=Littorina saxatilis TaxID=31220 RepID=A0AAN9BYU5_9CAEN
MFSQSFLLAVAVFVDLSLKELVCEPKHAYLEIPQERKSSGRQFGQNGKSYRDMMGPDVNRESKTSHSSGVLFLRSKTTLTGNTFSQAPTGKTTTSETTAVKLGTSEGKRPQKNELRRSEHHKNTLQLSTEAESWGKITKMRSKGFNVLNRNKRYVINSAQSEMPPSLSGHPSRSFRQNAPHNFASRDGNTFSQRRQQAWAKKLEEGASGDSPLEWCKVSHENSSSVSKNGGINQAKCGLRFNCPTFDECVSETGEGSNSGSVPVLRELCGDGNYCCCCQIPGFDEVVANCSRHSGKLKYIPKLPGNVTFLDFSGNRMVNISYGFFENITNVSSVDLSYNNLKTLAPEAFRGVRFSCIIMDNNFNLDISTYGSTVFNVSTLREVHLSNAYVVSVPDDIFRSSPGLKRVYLKNVNLRSWNTVMFQQLKDLQVLELSGNDMRFITGDKTSSFESLTDLNLVFNDLDRFPRSCVHGRKSIFPSLQKLNLSRNSIVKVSSYGLCFPSLQVLDIGNNPIAKLVTNVFGSRNFPRLTCLHMEHLEVREIQYRAFNNTSLQYLSLMYNYVDFVIENVNESSFRGLDNLVFLQLEQNYLDNKMFLRLFGHLTTLKYLFIGNTYFDRITTDTFAPFPHLKSITLHRNFFWEIPEGVFDGLQNLTHLDISNSRITTVREGTFSGDLIGRLEHLDLSGNFFRCDCDLLWFRWWLRSNTSLFDNSWSVYQCQNLPDTNVTYFQMNEQVCLMSHDASVFTVVVVTLLMIILTLVAVVFRYRWAIRLLLYEAFRGKGHNSQLPANLFRFDLFVSYAEEDVSWVRSHLLPELELGQGVRLCIHQRDFTPGQNIVDNIYQSVQDSRKVLMVFSRHFARSQWCQFELALCLSHVVEHDDTMLVTCVDDVTSSTELTPTMMAVLNTTTYIQWAEEDDAKASFWGRMRMALADGFQRENHVNAA